MAEKSESLVTMEDKVAQAKELYGRGSRNFLVKSYNDAADDLSQVCKLYEEIYGQVSDELGMPYLLYAKSLIALAQDENKVIDVPEEGADGDEDDEDDGDEDDNEEEENGDEKATPEEENKEAESETEKKNGTAEHESKPEETNGVAQDKPSTSNGQNGDGEEKEEAEEEDDAAANLQVAWEILELAAVIFERQGEKSLANLAEVYAELAGISFENSHFEAAICDYQKSLEIHIKLPEDNRRIIAEIHYKIGLAHLMLNSFDKCVEELKLASDLIDQEIEEEKQKEEQTDKLKDLIKDLEETKQDILAKIVEVEETKQQSIEEVRKELSKIINTNPQSTDGAGPSSSSSGADAGGSSSSVEKPKATDISHLIKRKKPDTQTAEPECSPAKRPAV